MNRPSGGDGLFTRSWRLFRVAFALVGGDRVLRSLAVLALAAYALAAVAIFTPVLDLLFDGRSLLFVFLLGAAGGFVLTFLATFLSVALLSEASARMDGNPTSARRGLLTAVRRLPQIAGWAVLSTGVGLILDALAERLPGAGHLLRFFGGLAWSLATMFAVPVLALEGRGPFGSAKRSGALFRERFGESAVGTISVTACTTFATVPGALLLCAGAGTGEVAGAGTVVAVMGIILVAGAGIAGILLHELFALALMRHMTHGGMQGGFSEADFAAGVRLKRRRRRR